MPVILFVVEFKLPGTYPEFRFTQYLIMYNGNARPVKFITHHKLLPRILRKHLRYVLYSFFVSNAYQMFRERTSAFLLQSGECFEKEVVFKYVNPFFIPYFWHSWFFKSFRIIVRLLEFLYAQYLREVFSFFPPSRRQRNY